MGNKPYYFSEPARYFEEALPLGNGKSGAMVYGGLELERISLNSDTLYSGHPEDLSVFEGKDKPEIWRRAREATLAGELDRASDLLENEFNENASQKYLPLGALWLGFGHSGATDYRRELDLVTGVATVSYNHGGVRYTRTCFVPKEEDAVVLHITASEPGSVSFTCRFGTELRVLEARSEGARLYKLGVCPSGYDWVRWEDGPRFHWSEREGDAVHFACETVALSSGGEVSSEGGVLTVKGADEVTLWCFCRTSYIDSVTPPTADFVGALNRATSEIPAYEDALARHIADFSSLMSRASISLFAPETESPLPERLAAFDGSDLGLYILLFDFGRYLTVAGSREGSRATNLQGIWNESMNPKWESSYTTNINLEMNYWPTLPTALPECYAPLVECVRNLLAPGREVARIFYGARGFVAHHNTDAWAHTVPVSRGRKTCSQWSPWPFASGWLAEQLFDYYEYTLDLGYLAEIYPILSEASRFYLDMLTEYNGKLIVSPATSPENVYHAEGERDYYAVAPYTAISQSIVRELFMHTEEAAALLGCEDEMTVEIRAALPRLQGLEIGSDGRLLEWDKEYPEVDPEHRHVSHLFAIYPGTTVTKEGDPELADAIEKSLRARGDLGTGWSLGWKINLWAALRDGDHAELMMRNQLALVDPRTPGNMNHGGSYPNLFDAHPPFQIDGNYGATAGIAGMLLASRRGEITVLPALPSDWENGSYTGLVAKGNVSVSVSWSDGKAHEIVLLAPIAQTITVKAGEKRLSVSLRADIPCIIRL